MAANFLRTSHGVRAIIVVLVFFPPVFQPTFNCEPASGHVIEILSYVATAVQFLVAVIEVTGPGELSSQGGEVWIPALFETERDKGKLSPIQIWPSCCSWWRHQMETFSASLAICAGNSPVSGEFPTQRPVTRSFDVFFDLCLNKRLRKQSRAGDLRRYRTHYGSERNEAALRAVRGSDLNRTRENYGESFSVL